MRTNCRSRTTRATSFTTARRRPFSGVQLFELLEQYYGFGPFLVGVAVTALILYFITSSDSGSLVVDLITSNGTREEPHWLQRVIWSFTEGGLAIGLMRAAIDDPSGGASARGLRALSIVCGLPFTVIICLMCTSLYRMLQFDDGRATRTQYEWKMHITGGAFDIFESASSFFGLAGGLPFDLNRWITDLFYFIVSAVFPFVPVYLVLEKVNRKSKYSKTASTVFGSAWLYNVLLCTFILACEVIFVVAMSIGVPSAYKRGVECYGGPCGDGGVHVVTHYVGNIGTELTLEEAEELDWTYGGWEAFGWVSYFFLAMAVTSVRTMVRNVYCIDGTVVEDLFVTTLGYFQVIHQMLMQYEEEIVEGVEVQYMAPTADSKITSV